MKAWAIVITIFLLFTICYSIYLNEIDYGVRDYDDYYDNPDCKPSLLDNGYTQLSNCAKYKWIEKNGND